MLCEHEISFHFVCLERKVKFSFCILGKTKISRATRLSTRANTGSYARIQDSSKWPSPNCGDLQTTLKELTFMSIIYLKCSQFLMNIDNIGFTFLPQPVEFWP